MRSEVDKAFERNRDPNQTLSEEETLIAKLRLLDDLIVQDLLVARAPALQITVSDAEIDKAYTDAKSGAADDVFKQELTRRNLTETDVRDSIRRDLTVQKVVQKEVTDKVTVSDQEVTDVFNANKSSFNLPEDAVHIAQIVVTPGRDQQVANRSGNDATTPQEAQSKVATLMQRLQAGEAFGDLARNYSEDPESAPRGGDMGLVAVSAIRRAPAALRDAVLEHGTGTRQRCPGRQRAQDRPRCEPREGGTARSLHAWHTRADHPSDQNAQGTVAARRVFEHAARGCGGDELSCEADRRTEWQALRTSPGGLQTSPAETDRHDERRGAAAVDGRCNDDSPRGIRRIRLRG